MRVLLIRPIAPNERFGLGPFFRIESLGLEYIGAALEAAGHTVSLVDLRFAALEPTLRAFQPHVAGVAAAHTLDTNEALAVAARVKAVDPRTFVLMGGHAAAVYSSPFFVDAVDAICCEDGEAVVPELVSALEQRRSLLECPGLWVRPPGERGDFVRTAENPERVSLDRVPLPARHLMAPFQRNFLCVDKQPVYLVETARGCPYRCSFCTIWRHVDRSYRCRAIDHVCRDLATVGENIFFADDLFFYPKRRAVDLAEALHKRGIRKNWALIQTRTDLVARNPDVLQAWRPFANHFDIFFGFESPTNEGLDGYTKDSGVQEIKEAIAVCTRLGFGITGNFIVDPDWKEDDFRRLWDFTAKHKLTRAGFTIMTPLPGTPLYETLKARIVETDWSKYDMHHVLWEPALGRRRFFELFAESWKRTVLNAFGEQKKWWTWLFDVKPHQIPMMMKVLIRTQRLMDPRAYVQETFQQQGGPSRFQQGGLSRFQ